MFVAAATRCSLLSVFLGLFTTSGQAATLKRIASIDLPGPRGQHFDHLAIDSDDHYLLSAYLTPGILYVIDTRTNKLVKAIRGLPGITAPVYVDGKHKAYTCDWGENKIGVVDLKQMKITKKLPTKQKPNGGTYAEAFGKAYISDTLGKEIAVIDVRADSIAKVLHFASEIGMVQYDRVGRKIYANLRSNRRVAEIDPASDKVIATYPAGDCEFNHAMALDPAGRRAFLLCGGNNVLAIFDINAHRPIAYIPLPSGGDDIAFDPGLRRIYVACESGAIAVMQEDDADHFRKLEDFPVPQGVHTLVVDAQTHRVYAPAAQEMGRPVARMLVYAAEP